MIDVPRQPNQEDLFGIQVYQEALIEYIKYTGTPITIALQGEWGSGKTSLMNSLRTCALFWRVDQHVAICIASFPGPSRHQHPGVDH